MNTMKLYLVLFVAALSLEAVCAEVIRRTPRGKTPRDNTADNTGDTEETVDEEKLEYAKGSVCRYCQYCEFCPMCEQDCPCPAKSKKPACHMCKYCNYCRFCQLCDAICTPGGILDRVSSSLVSMLPSINHAEVDDDIEGVQKEIKKHRTEL